MIEHGSATEDEMVLAFLRAETESPRFHKIYQAALQEFRLEQGSLIDRADLSNRENNQAAQDYCRPSVVTSRMNYCSGVFRMT